MAAFVDNSSVDALSERNSMAITLNIHAKSHTVRGRPTLTLVERFGNGSVRERSIYERSFTSEHSIEKYQAKLAHVNTIAYLDVIENPVEYQKLLRNVSEEGKETKGICLCSNVHYKTQRISCAAFLRSRTVRETKSFISYIAI